MEAPLRVGLIGYGLAGSAFHAPLINATPGLQLTAVVARGADRAAAVARRYPHAQVVTDADDLWRLELDAVTVATPNATHVPLARDAIDHGVAVVVDKPLAPNSTAARMLVAESRARDVPLTVYLNRRWDGDFQTVRGLVSDGSLGRIVRFESRFERWRPEVVDSWKERAGPGEAGGILFDLGPHLVDQALQLFGPVAEVYAEVSATRPGALNDDDVFLALRHCSGVLSHLHASAVAADLGPRFRVLGTGGAYSVRGLDVQEAALRAGADPATSDAWGRVPQADWGQRSGTGGAQPVETAAGDYPEFYRRWAATLLAGAPVPVDPDDAVYGLRVIEAARKSSAERVTVTLAG
ncbi:MAG: Gfo/Idh/MocA family oxidoreductase [Candidatus Nanopelagicales bacterium]